MAEEQPSDVVETVQLVSMGVCRLSDGKEGRQYRQIVDGEPAGKEWVFDKSITKYMGGQAGSVYQVETVNGKSVRLGSVRFLKLWDDREKRAEWQAMSDAARMEFEAERRHDKAKKDDAVFECLEPIRRAYRRAVGLHRHIILVRAIMVITRPGKD